jgi:hypothetical protein
MSYFAEFKKLPRWVYEGGLQSDIVISKVEFEQYINSVKDTNIYRHLYLADCQSLIGSIQDMVQSINSNFINFYVQLANVNVPYDNGTFWTLSSETSLLFSVLIT